MAALARWTGSLERGEEAAADAVARAVEVWPRDGTPDRPGAWLMTTARRRLLDRWRHDEVLRRKLPLLARDAELVDERDITELADLDGAAVRDDLLRLVFACCHPALPLGGQVALALRHLCGLTTDEVARAFCVPEATVAQRLVRAKKKITHTAIAYREPTAAELPDRLPAVLTVVSLVFTEGHTATSGDALVRNDLCAQALHLARVLVQLMPEQSEVLGLLATLLLTHARRAARTDDRGRLVRLEQQDRRQWDWPAITEGLHLTAGSLRRSGARPGRWSLTASIAACHSADPVDWPVVVTLYDRLLATSPDPVASLNRAVAVARADGAAAGLVALESSGVAQTHLSLAARAELLRQLGRDDDAATALRQALPLARNAVERQHLADQLDRVGGGRTTLPVTGA